MKVGDYVRTECGIAKIIGTEAQDLVINLDKAIMIYHPEYIASCTHDEIIKSSSNIIDLIEVGDYVNGHLVFDIAYARKKAVYIEDNQNKLAHRPYTNEDIYSIVTKEQFESMEYKVGE